MAVNATLFGAVGTAGQRCTSLRRVIVHQAVYDEFVAKLVRKYQTIIKVGDPMEEGTLCGPLINEASVKDFEDGIREILQSDRSRILCGGKRMESVGPHFVEPTVVETVWDEPFVSKELFGPVLYVMKCSSFEDAVQQHNKGSVHGLSSSLFTKDNGRARLGLRHRQCQHWNLWRRDWRRVWRREADRSGPRVWVGRLETVHAEVHVHDQLQYGFATRSG